MKEYVTIIADSGSTKTDWLIGNERVNTQGINPILQDDDTLSVVNNLAPVAPTGYKTTIVPYALMLAAGLALLLLRGRRKSNADA